MVAAVNADETVKTTQENARVFTDYLLKTQENNVRLAEEFSKFWTEGLRRQAKINERVLRTSLGESERGGENFREFFERWTWRSTPPQSWPFSGFFPFDPFELQRNRVRRMQEAAGEMMDAASSTSGVAPIPGYDEMSVQEVSRKADTLPVAQIEQMREYEKRTKNRKSLIEDFDRRLQTVS